MYLVHQRAELLAHIQNTNAQYNLQAFGKKIAYKSNRAGISEVFTDPMVQKSIEVDIQLSDTYDTLIRNLERELLH
jgi:hypothetical protein